ncbi:MAG: fluoride efflux transporter CrcB [Thermodesulfobacteriota bacterium]
MKSILLVMAGGCLGAVCRFGLSWAAAAVYNGRFPLGTLAANLIGCFFIGAAFAMADRTPFFGPSARLFFMTGFVGALTTFSTYALESIQAFRGGDPLTAGMNILASNVFGFASVLAGMWVVKRLLANG